jgi:ubiquinone/menaquinone biosynthesis C-methylase UbiE
MGNSRIRNGYKSISSIYDNYITGSNLFFRIIAKIIWGFYHSDYVEQLLESIPNNFSGKILDVPTGTGVLTCDKYSKLNNSEIICIDYSRNMLEIAKNRFEKNNLKNVKCGQGDIETLPFKNKTFDIVLSMNSFHAFMDKEKAFMETKRVLKDNGIFIGCFYVSRVTKRTDWFVKHFLAKLGTFTPPFYSLNEVKEKLNRSYKEVNLWNTNSIVSFICKNKISDL